MYRKPYIDIYMKNNFHFNEAKAEVDFLLDTLFNYSYKDYALDKPLLDWQCNKLLNIINERVTTRKPVQQIIGMAYFCGKKFFVNEYTLIPRPETELLASKVLALSNNFSNPKILDIGTGTGCIPITLLLQNSNITADCVDISPETLEIAKKNSLFHNILKNINFIKSDLFENVNDKYDIIVSNPPYIPIKDKDKLQYEVKTFDPELALFANDELGIEFYKKIIKEAVNFLNKDGFIAFELGINQYNYVYDLLQNYGYKNIEITKDFNSIERIITAQI